MNRQFLWSMLMTLILLPAYGETWYVRHDGGTRYSAKVLTGQCDGKADAPYRGSGVNQHCAFKDYRYLWDDQSYGSHAWVIAGGDTVILRDGPWRVGFDASSGKGAGYTWCFGGGGPYGCTNPIIPPGTPGRHTRILGENYAGCSNGNATNRSKLTQIFGGFGATYALDLTGARYVDVQCLEITNHNGKCVSFGVPQYPRGCVTGGPTMDDYDSNGVGMSDTTSNVDLKDLYIHGHTSAGIKGPIGGPIMMTRTYVGFNGFAGWNFDDGKNTPDGPGSSINASYVTMEGNGCDEEYPIVHAFPGLACYDQESAGASVGDSWSGQETVLDSFVCDHCIQRYNTKDGFIGPHTKIKKLLIENSQSIGNMGQQWKWGSPPNSSTTFVNNITVGNCMRMSQQLPGAPINYNQAAGHPGGRLSLFCRASGDIFSFYSASNSTVLFGNNTIVGYSQTVFDLNCLTPGTCGSTPYVFRNNVVLGFLDPNLNPSEPQVPGLMYYSEKSDVVTADHNLYYHLRSRLCPWTKNICSDPGFVSEPAKTLRSESDLDNFNFYPWTGSALVGAGVPIGGTTKDFYGVARPNPPSIGAVEPRHN